MPLIVGLGNPGRKYAGTRHNVGFEVIDKLAESHTVKLRPGKGLFQTGDIRYQGQKVVLVKPTTYMNLSGDAVIQALKWFKTDPEECLICYDDLNIPIGTLRLRPDGSAGGHNGIKDVIKKLGTNQFPRLRMGIGDDFPEGRQVDYVLSKFTENERKLMEEVTGRACKAALTFTNEGIEAAMNKFNG